MAIKQRNESLELKLLRALNLRMNLSVKDSSYYLNLEKGFEGEQNFDIWSETLSNDWIIIDDLLLEKNNTFFQIDTLLISHETLFPLEIKNYDGDFYIDNDKWFTRSGAEIKNPLLQLKRSESLLRRLLQDLGFNFSIEPYLIFVNPEFYLYEAPLNLPIIFPTQLKRFIEKLNMKKAKLNEKDSQLADRLLSLHVKSSPYKRVPDYTYATLKKGIICKDCCSLHTDCKGQALIHCNECGHEEKLESAILRSIEELKLLFPDRKLTTNTVFEWCKIIKSKKTIRRILLKNFKIMGHGISSYYV
ncbi:hypothetical protein JOD43_003785 [Pullulanibacillus pueri]|uniref:NERD domain-containing protein n=1 Tax=Pullulanibacillus pueri TaxID=1437324 RepID=A0A8J3EMV1_9BACL|nr:nuclease-related domain-containing protein [Pullulanibacillus pueri]MBM7683605.1 hypothetical protein [Pullulanibacillus pueri]GGH84563.1 hypothetical protein GCM10007096_27930 [Pullulanibacillus pueri]